jgi:hypothetical protein
VKREGLFPRGFKGNTYYPVLNDVAVPQRNCTILNSKWRLCRATNCGVVNVLSKLVVLYLVTLPNLVSAFAVIY